MSAPAISDLFTDPVPGTERVFAFPPNVKRFQVLNAGDHTVTFGWNPGDSALGSGHSSSLYARDAYNEDQLVGASLTFYFQSAFPSQRLEVSYWT